MHSLRWKLFVLFVGLGLSSSLIMYIPYSRYIRATYQEKIANVLKIIDTDYHNVLADPDNLVRLGSEGSHEYWSVVYSISNIAHINDIEYIYYVRPEGETFRFVFSSEETPDTPVDEVFSQYETQDISQAMETAYKTGTLQISQTPYTDAWGTFVSAYIPITRNGSIVGILGADYEISKIKNYEFRAVLSLIVSAIIAVALALLLSMSLIRPIRALEKAAGSIANMDFGIHIAKFRKDEIGSMQRALIKIRDNLKTVIEQLEYSNIVLEAKVHDRTLELEEQTEIAVQASRAKSEFLATMSHELRTPLNAVIGLAQIELQNKPKGNLPVSTLKHISQIHQSGQHLLGILNDILDISKIEAGSFELIPVEYETPSFISDTVKLNMVRLGSKPVNFVLEIGSDFPLKLKADELRVKQILNNLLSNAAKYTHEGTVILSVECEKEEGKNATHLDVKTRFTVRDTGVGIRAKDMEKMFTKYGQLDTGTNRKTEGTGLGLFITKKLVEMMGGSISVESEYGKGSVFTVEIIQELVDSADGESGSIGEKTAEDLRNFRYVADGQAGKKEDGIVYFRFPDKRVLVVDDLSMNLLVVKGLLHPYGVQVDTASSGNEAIEKVKQNNYDLILMDHMMPKMDGVETMAHLHKIDGFNTPVVVLTANALRGMKEFYLEQGFQDYLSKPIDPQALDEVINKWINTKEKEKGKEINVNIEAALDAQRLDKLNHFRAAFAFDSGREIDEEYFEKFAALVESVNMAHLPITLQEQAVLLATAGRLRDARKIRETLPAFCEALQSRADTQPTETEIADGILQRLKNALQEDDTKKAGKIVTELGAVRLSPEGRELYFSLYDLLMEDNTQEALGRIEEWLKY